MTTFRKFIEENFGISNYTPVVRKATRLPKDYEPVANFSFSSEKFTKREGEFYMARGVVSKIIENRGIGMIKAENCQSYPYELEGTDFKVGDNVEFNIEDYHACNVKLSE